MHRFVAGNFIADSEPTLGGAFMAKIVVVHGTQIKYQVWELMLISELRIDLGYSRTREISFSCFNVL